MRVLPSGWAEQIKSGKAILLGTEIPNFPPKCSNCDDGGFLILFLITGGAYQYSTAKGAHWLTHQGKTGWWTGTSEWAACPVCKSGHMKSSLENICGLRGADLEINISGFKADRALINKAPARDLAARLLGRNLHPQGFATFWGNYGTGKSHLLKAITNGFRLVGIMSHYSILSDLLAVIRDKFGNEDGKSGSVQSAVEYYKNIRVLCLDEIDKVNPTSWVKETVHRIVEDRFNRREDVLTAFASNLAPNALPPEFGYLLSRMSGGDIVEVAGADMRPVVKEMEVTDYRTKVED